MGYLHYYCLCENCHKLDDCAYNYQLDKWLCPPCIFVLPDTYLDHFVITGEVK